MTFSRKRSMAANASSGSRLENSVFAHSEAAGG